MVKKIGFLILSVAILVIGIIAFSKLGYWDRSVRIFNYSSNTPFEGRMGRGPEGREGFARPEMRELPDSLRQQFGAGNGERTGRGSIEGGLRNSEGPWKR